MWLEISRSENAKLWQVELLLEPSEMESIQGSEPVWFVLPVLPGQVFELDPPFRSFADPFMTGRIVHGVWRAAIRTVGAEPKDMSSARRAIAQHINAGIQYHTRGRAAAPDG